MLAVAASGVAECPQTQEACLLIVGGDEPAPATGTDCL